MTKRTYISPTLRVTPIAPRQGLLSGSYVVEEQNDGGLQTIGDENEP